MTCVFRVKIYEKFFSSSSSAHEQTRSLKYSNGVGCSRLTLEGINTLVADCDFSCSLAISSRYMSCFLAVDYF